MKYKERSVKFFTVAEDCELERIEFWDDFFYDPFTLLPISEHSERTYAAIPVYYIYMKISIHTSTCLCTCIMMYIYSLLYMCYCVSFYMLKPRPITKDVTAWGTQRLLPIREICAHHWLTSIRDKGCLSWAEVRRFLARMKYNETKKKLEFTSLIESSCWVFDFRLNFVICYQTFARLRPLSWPLHARLTEAVKST